MKFSEFATQTVRPQLHIPHVEDLIFLYPHGAALAEEVLTEAGMMLATGHPSPHLSLSTKWDGAPSLVFGPDPEDGRFFVATKSAFNLKRKLAKMHAEIDILYPQPGLAKTLHLAFDELPALGATTILQGDVLFADKVQTVQNIDGSDYWVFRPNTILYGIPVSQIEDYGLERTRLILMLHTEYDSDWVQHSLRSETFAALTPSPFVEIHNAAEDDVSGMGEFTEHEYEIDFQMARATLHSVMRSFPGDIYDLITQPKWQDHLLKFINHCVRQNLRLPADSLFRDFVIFLRTSTYQRVDMAAQAMTHQQDFLKLFDVFVALDALKTVIVDRLSDISRYVNPIYTFVEENGKIRETAAEGFVARMDGLVTKLVNRFEFSRLNFTLPKTW